jgi:hypothetical protein
MQTPHQPLENDGSSNWHFDEDGHLTHSCGLKYRIKHGHGFVSLFAHEASLVIFQARQSSKGERLIDVVEHVQRITREAQSFYTDVLARSIEDQLGSP